MAAHTLYLLHCGLLDETGPDGPRTMPVPAYLIVSAAGKRYLVDTGNPSALIGAANCGKWFDTKCRIAPEDDPVARIAELGLGPRDIDAIIATHLDFDHAGRFDAFAPFGPDVWIQRAHMAAALSDPERYDPRLWNLPGLRWRNVDGDLGIEPGLWLIRTDGHATGHQSLLVETDAGWVVLAADAIDGPDYLDDESLLDSFEDAEAARCSSDRLLALAAEHVAPIIYGHDLEQWQSLPHGPEPYRRN